MNRLYTLLIFVLLLISFTDAWSQTRVRGHYNRLGQWVPTHYRPYYPGDIYRRNQVPVVVVVPGQQVKPASTPQISLPANGDNTGLWVEAEQKREENGKVGLEFAKQEAARIDRENAIKRKANKNADQ